MFLHGAHVQLDLWPGGGEDVEAVIGGPLEEDPEVVAVRLEGPGAVAGQERRRVEVGFVDRDLTQVVTGRDGPS